MTATSHRIASYQYEFRVEPGQPDSLGLAVLYLYDEHKTLLAMLVFHDKGGQGELPRQAAAGYVTAQLPRGQLGDLIDMLRNEKPVYFSWTPETQSVRITSDEEPVGEQELRKLLSWFYI